MYTLSHLTIKCRSSRSEVFCKKGVLRNFGKIYRKTFEKTLQKNFAKFLRTPFVTEHLWWLPLLKEILTFHDDFISVVQNSPNLTERICSQFCCQNLVNVLFY